MMALRPPPPPTFPTRFPTELKNAGSELVTAVRLRPNDWLVTNEGPLHLRDVQRFEGWTRLRTGDVRRTSEWWAVPSSTKFRRLIQKRRIEMRPDLRGDR